MQNTLITVSPAFIVSVHYFRLFFTGVENITEIKDLMFVITK